MIAIRGLTKRYKDVLAVDDLTLEIPSGSVCGLLGRNGAGKTTAFKCLLGFARPDAGDTLFDGQPLTPATFETLGYVPERPQLYGWMTVAQHLELIRRSHPKYDAKRANELLGIFRLDRRKKAKRLSKGQQTALSLIIVLATNPSLLLLDEPASGLDPVMQRAVLDLLIDAATSGATILLSSHQIGQIERAADHVAILRDGRLVLSGEIDDLRAASKVVEATFEHGIPDTAEIAGVKRFDRAGKTLRAYTNGRAEAVAARFGELGGNGVRVVDRTLEDIFLDAVSYEGTR